MAATFFTFLFCVSAIGTILLGFRREWRYSRLIALLVAIASFMLALLTAQFGK